MNGNEMIPTKIKPDIFVPQKIKFLTNAFVVSQKPFNTIVEPQGI